MNIPLQTCAWFIAPVLLSCVALADVSQDTPAPGDTPQIIGPIDDGAPKPAAPEPVKPTFEVTETVVRESGDHAVILNRVKKPATLNRPALPALEIGNAAVQTQISEMQEEAPETTIHFLSATVYDDSQTIVRWWHDGEEFAALSNVDFRHLFGFNSFRYKEKEYGLLFGLSKASTGQQHDQPSVPAGVPSFVLFKGNAANAAALEVIQGLHELYKVEGTRLKVAYEGRERLKKELEAQQQANPPVVKDTVIHYWPKNSRRHSDTKPSTHSGNAVAQ